jgi:anti-sigma B factor antagonist
MSDRSDGVRFTLRLEENGEAVVAVGGEMDAAHAHAVENELLRIETTGISRIVLDLSSLDFIESTGLAVIVRAHERAGANGLLLGVTRPQGLVMRVFEQTGLDRALDFVEGATTS